jgi:metal-responsive CopG/Arc/MetJ family transcriptional regulator
MRRAKVAITVDEQALAEIDQLVVEGVYPNRSRAFEAAIQERIAKLRGSRLARECARLIPAEEQAHADERFAGETQWPEY